MSKENTVSETAESTIDIIQAKLASLEEIVAEQDVKIAELEAENEKLRTTAPATRSVANAALPEFTIGKKRYAFTAGRFKLDGETLEAAKVVNDEDFLKTAIIESYGFIKEVK